MMNEEFDVWMDTNRIIAESMNLLDRMRLQSEERNKSSTSPTNASSSLVDPTDSQKKTPEEPTASALPYEPSQPYTTSSKKISAPEGAISRHNAHSLIKRKHRLPCQQAPTYQHKKRSYSVQSKTIFDPEDKMNGHNDQSLIKIFKREDRLPCQQAPTYQHKKRSYSVQSKTIFDPEDKMNGHNDQSLIKIFKREDRSPRSNSAQPKNFFKPEKRMSRRNARTLIEMLKQKRQTRRACVNSIRGCPITSYKIVTELHEEFCAFNPAQVSPEGQFSHSIVQGMLNWYAARTNKFRPFCNTFESTMEVSFLFKINKEDNGLKIWVAGYKNTYNFSITLLSQDTPIFRFNGTTHGEVKIIPGPTFKRYGPKLKYTIKLFNTPLSESYQSTSKLFGASEMSEEL